MWWQQLRNCRFWTQPQMLLSFSQRMYSALLQMDCCLKCLRAEQGKNKKKFSVPGEHYIGKPFLPEEKQAPSLEQKQASLWLYTSSPLISHSQQVQPANCLTWVIMKVWTYICMHVGNLWSCQPGSFYWCFCSASGITQRTFQFVQMAFVRILPWVKWICFY